MFAVLRTSMPGLGVGQNALRPWLTTPKASPSLPANSPAGSSSRVEYAAEAAGVGFPVQPLAGLGVEGGDLEVRLGLRLGLEIAEVPADVDRVGVGRHRLHGVADLLRPQRLHVDAGAGADHRERVGCVARRVVEVAGTHDEGLGAVRRDVDVAHEPDLAAARARLVIEVGSPVGHGGRGAGHVDLGDQRSVDTVDLAEVADDHQPGRVGRQRHRPQAALADVVGRLGQRHREVGLQRSGTGIDRDQARVGDAVEHVEVAADVDGRPVGPDRHVLDVGVRVRVEPGNVRAGVDVQLGQPVVCRAADGDELAADEDGLVVGRGLDDVDLCVGVRVEVGDRERRWRARRRPGRLRVVMP